jgi:hypothetical protein
LDLAVPNSIGHVDDKAYRKPRTKPQPGIEGHLTHQEQCRQGAERRHDVNGGRPEGTSQVWPPNTQRKYAKADNGESKQSTYTDQLTDQPDRQ